VDDFLTVRQVAERLHVSPKRAYAMLSAGVVPSVKIGARKRVIPAAAWQAWVQAQTTAALRGVGEVAQRAAS
jgi:excisionase family DNA binding protein